MEVWPSISDGSAFGPCGTTLFALEGLHSGSDLVVKGHFNINGTT
jgi:hypothetical protein